MSPYVTTSLSPFMSITILTNTPGCWLWCNAMLTVTCRRWMLSQMGPYDHCQLSAEQMTPDNSLWIRIISPLPPFLAPCLADVSCLQYVRPAFCNWMAFNVNLPYLRTTELSILHYSCQAQKPALQIILLGVLRCLGKDSLPSETDAAALNCSVSVHYDCVGLISAWQS